jgi:hypothetical protein
MERQNAEGLWFGMSVRARTIVRLETYKLVAFRN